MLTPRYLEHLPDRIVQLMSEIENDMLAKVAEHLKKYSRITGTAEYLTLKQTQYGLLYNDLLGILSAKSGIVEKEIEALYNEAGIKSLSYDTAVMAKAADKLTLGIAGIASREALQATLKVAIERAKSIQNITNTTCLQSALRLYTNAVDKAYLSVASGAVSIDSAYRRALDELAYSGITTAEYVRNGKIYNYSLEANVRRNIITTINSTAGKLTEDNMAAYGFNIVETTSHAGARPSHAVWQGRRFWFFRYEKGYESFHDVCGYGQADGIMGINCRHSFYPCDPSVPSTVDTDPAKHQLGIENDEQYKLTQKQRYLERRIREAKKQQAVFEAGGDEVKAAEAGRKIRERQAAMRAFLKQHSTVSRDRIREQIQR